MLESIRQLQGVWCLLASCWSSVRAMGICFGTCCTRAQVLQLFNVDLCRRIQKQFDDIGGSEVSVASTKDGPQADLVGLLLEYKVCPNSEHLSATRSFRSFVYLRGCRQKVLETIPQLSGIQDVVALGDAGQQVCSPSSYRPLRLHRFFVACGAAVGSGRDVYRRNSRRFARS